MISKCYILTPVILTIMILLMLYLNENKIKWTIIYSISITIVIVTNIIFYAGNKTIESDELLTELLTEKISPIISIIWLILTYHIITISNKLNKVKYMRSIVIGIVSLCLCWFYNNIFFVNAFSFPDGIKLYYAIAALWNIICIFVGVTVYLEGNNKKNIGEIVCLISVYTIGIILLKYKEINENNLILNIIAIIHYGFYIIAFHVFLNVVSNKLKQNYIALLIWLILFGIIYALIDMQIRNSKLLQITIYCSISYLTYIITYRLMKNNKL